MIDEALIIEAQRMIKELMIVAYAAGRNEAENELQAKLTNFFGRQSDPVPFTRRAIHGTVKSTITHLIIIAKNGISMDDIIKATGFKVRTIRKTLWRLKQDGIIDNTEKHRVNIGLWFAVNRQ